MRPSDDLIVSATEPTGANRKKVWIQKGKNLFDINDIYGNYIIGDNGELTSNSVWTVSNKISKIKAGNSYVMSWSKKATGVPQIEIGEYKTDGTFIKNNFRQLNENDTFCSITLSSTTAYIMIAYRNDRLTNIQLEQGSTATSYEAYIEPKIYVKNGNDVYEEFISKEDALEKYSTTEQKVGTWIDGKPLYRKVQDVVLENNSGDVGLSGGTIQNVDKVINIYGIIPYSSTSDSKVPINSYIDNTHYSSFYFFKKQNVLRAFIGSAFAGLTANVIVEYTKTTD